MITLMQKRTMTKMDKDKRIVGLAKPYFMMAFDETFAKRAEPEMLAFIAQYDGLAKSKWHTMIKTRFWSTSMR